MTNYEDEIKVGDEVYYKDKPYIKFVVTRTRGEQFCDKDATKWIKTGRHFNIIEELLKQMQEDDGK